MSVVHSNCSFFTFNSLLLNPSRPRNHHHLSFSHTSFLSPHPHPNFPSNRNVALKASLENPLPPVSVDQNTPPQSAPLISASDVVRNFYDGINRHDLAAVEPLIAENCVYEDLVFPSPFVGRKSILEFFGKFIDSISTDLQFVIDAISEEDSSAVGVTWHLDWKGRPFPFSKGCSFYQLRVVNGNRQIIYARDSVEPAIKPGESALIAIRGVTWLLQQFPNLAERF